jgi:hypothetical protein
MNVIQARLFAFVWSLCKKVKHNKGKKMIKKFRASIFRGSAVYLLATFLLALTLNACGPVTAIAPTTPAALPIIASAPTIVPTAIPTSQPTEPPAITLDCPISIVGTLLLKDEDGSYCFLYPEGHGVVTPPVAGEVCLVPGQPPYMECNGASLVINVEEADGRTVDQATDAVAVDCSDKRSNLTISNEKAVLLSECKGQDLSRKVFIVHTNRLYTLTFTDLSEQFYEQIITSFVFLR